MSASRQLPVTPAALGRAFDAHAAALVLYARQWLDREAARDIVQEAFVRLMGQPAEPQHLAAWLFTTVRHAAISAARSRRRRSDREARAAADRPGFLVPAEATPESRLDAARAQEALSDLPAEQREVIVLRIWGGRTFQEIARIVEAPVSTVHHHYHAGLAALRERLEAPQHALDKPREEPCH